MRVFSLLGNTVALDAGTLFAHVPRAMWSRWVDVDDLGRVKLAGRCLLVEDTSRRILVETGPGMCFPEKLRRRYGINPGGDRLLESLDALSLSEEDIHWIILSHLHFDHAGGLVASHHLGQPLRLRFPNARIMISRDAWERSLRPHSRDRASFVRNLSPLLRDSGRLRVVADEHEAEAELGEPFRFRLSEGHTPGMLLPSVVGSRATLLFAGDLVPATPWLHLPITMGYDRHAELLVDEKAQLYAEMDLDATYLFYTHDPRWAASRIAFVDGRYTPTDLVARIDAWDLNTTVLEQSCRSQLSHQQEATNVDGNPARDRS